MPVTPTKQPNPAEAISRGLPRDLCFYLNLCHLKHIFRKGWLQRGVPPEQTESVADHQYAVAVLAMLLAETYFPDLDLLKVLRLSLLHDLGEIGAGDITPADHVPPGEKSRRERASFQTVLRDFPARDRYLEDWEEYRAGQTPEALFVRQVEKLEMALQAVVYERQGVLDADEFFRTVEAGLRCPKLREILEEAGHFRLQPPG